MGSAGTAQQPAWGWRHFQVKFVFVAMVAVCDPQVWFWLNAQQLRNRCLWQPGWQSLQKMPP
ncbi:MAG: TIGR02450 family Trp-rich protein [Gloeomargarita sp. GMQP_bins_120]